jgi:hypothetical protein
MKNEKEIILRQAINSIITKLMERIMERVLYKDPFNKEAHQAKKPLYAALVPDEIFKGSHFERRFVTPFGGVWEKLCVAAATASMGFAEQSYTVNGQIREGRLRRIQEILNKLEHQNGTEKRQPNFEKEIEYIKKGKGELIPITIICDVFIRNEATGESFAFEIKGPLPNSDQTKVSKEKIFKLFAMEEPQITKAFFALPYNPYGTKAEYNWSFPKRWFDMNNSPIVLIAEEFWDFIGGVGTYELFIDEVNQLGKHYKERIYKEFLGIEPPNID